MKVDETFEGLQLNLSFHAELEEEWEQVHLSRVSLNFSIILIFISLTTQTSQRYRPSKSLKNTFKLISASKNRSKLQSIVFNRVLNLKFQRFETLVEMTTSSKHAQEKQKIVDQDDDLDDLDDVLSEFNSSSQSPPPSAHPIAPHGRPRNNTRVDAPPPSIPGSGSALDPTSEADEDALSSEFAKELALGMESLMREITGEVSKSDVDADGSETTEDERARAFKAAWEAMLIEGMDANIAGAGDASAKKESSSTSTAGGFQDKIKQAMEKLKESETKLGGSTSGAGAPSDPESLEALLKSLGDLGLGEGEDDEKELAGFLENMMGQLMSKDVLYEPLKELADGFPPYLEKPPSPLSAEDRKRYESQLVCVRQILAVFEKDGYSDTNAECNKQIVDLMSEMQSYGSPPSEIMGPLPAGLDGAGGIPGLNDENCTIA
ncbi:Peroxisome biogenesis protein 19-1 [Psilocybe cubensis]|uniref:Peroxisome biogenesis protein 19-1 n=2 Tax=Psilocybe cubensis TaxID=181762 RepID=A0ACB8GKM9_PSICU|nr:Peroxisome biogenesis protein 19-1 [Psilocybe cubensis]KAH9476275.1 Peroxisome biogenesis protein 19-1 [Psilocybe cubensis]